MVAFSLTHRTGTTAQGSGTRNTGDGSPQTKHILLPLVIVRDVATLTRFLLLPLLRACSLDWLRVLPALLGFVWICFAMALFSCYSHPP